MLTLTTIAGRPAMVIPLPKNGEKTYLFRLNVDGEAWSLDIESEAGDEYTVWLGANGQQQCGCRAYEFSKDQPHNCKHCRAAQELRNILTAIFAGQPQEVGATW